MQGHACLATEVWLVWAQEARLKIKRPCCRHVCSTPYLKIRRYLLARSGGNTVTIVRNWVGGWRRVMPSDSDCRIFTQSCIFLCFE